jgi:DNA-binding transcriptional LysR family regulator
MQFEQLSYLIAVSKTHSISKAAEEVFVTPQNISNSLRKLENEFNVTLIRRSSRGVSLSPEGERFVQIAGEILAKVGELKQIGCPARGECHFKFYLPFNINPELVGRKVAAFCRQQPDFQITVVNKSREGILKELRNASKSGGMLLMPRREYRQADYEEMELDVVKSANDRLVACVSEKLPLSRLKSTSVPEILKLPLVNFEYLDGSVMVLDTLRRYGEPNIVLSTSNSSLFWQALGDGGGVGFAMHDKCVNNGIPEQYKLRLVPVRSKEAEFDYTFILLKSKRSSLTPEETKLLIQMI